MSEANAETVGKRKKKPKSEDNFDLRHRLIGYRGKKKQQNPEQVFSCYGSRRIWGEAEVNEGGCESKVDLSNPGKGEVVKGATFHTHGSL